MQLLLQKNGIKTVIKKCNNEQNKIKIKNKIKGNIAKCLKKIRGKKVCQIGIKN